MGRMSGAMMGGAMRGMREMAAAGMVWALNGRADMPDAPLLEAARGQTVRLRLVNDTAWPHAMHLHGHHFRRVDGPAPGPWRDTLLMDRGETAEIAFVADNPGDWLLHCHMLAHAATGMMTWVRVT
jgi:FtsP/CotA-like multicopper oxidase with cupredoxin domain